MKHVVRVTETFSKLIVVEADSEQEAIDKCWNELENSSFLTGSSPVLFNYITDNSEIDYSIGTKEDRKTVFFREDKYDHLD